MKCRDIFVIIILYTCFVNSDNNDQQEEKVYEQFCLNKKADGQVIDNGD